MEHCARTGRVGENVTIDEAKEDARKATINALAVLKAHIGSLDKVQRCVKITGYIASAPDFAEQPKVLNAASDLLFDIFGKAGSTRPCCGRSIHPPYALPVGNRVHLRGRVDALLSFEDSQESLHRNSIEL